MSTEKPSNLTKEAKALLAKAQKQQVTVTIDPVAEEMEKTEAAAQSGTLGAILKSLKTQNTQQAERMALEIDPRNEATGYGALYRKKNALTPDEIIKKIVGPQGDDLVSQIIQARSNYMAAFGRPLADRFKIGFKFEELNKNIRDREDFDEIQKRLEKVKEVFWNCGYKGLEEDWSPNLSQFLKMITRDGLSYGRFATEFIYVIDQKTGKEKLHSFRASDAGTMYRVIPKREADQSARIEAIRLLSELKNKKIDKERYKKDEYKWVQVIQGNPVQAFSDKEMVVYSLYPTTNVEYNGYPLTPIDQSLNAIITHINITLYNKLYFEHGRASRGMLIVKSDSVDEHTIQRMRLQFHQSINATKNAWRMPVFGIGTDADITWQSIDVSGRDAEFQYLSDNNARVILSAFQMSPDELPGYGHLSKGTNTQSLSESDNEYKMTAARDVGLRPLIFEIQDFLNTHVFPKIDEGLSKMYQITLAGLDAVDAEKESTRLQQDQNLHMTYDEILESVEKDMIGPEMGGKLPLNPQFNEMVSPYLTVGQIKEYFFKHEGASKDPRFNYYRDPFYFQQQQMLLQKAQMAMQNQMMAMQTQMQAAMPQQLEQPGAEGEGQEFGGEEQQGQPPEEGQEQQPEQLMMKEKNKKMGSMYAKLLKANQTNADTLSQMIINRHQELVDKQMDKWADKSKKALDDIIKVVKKDEDK